jgi:hypothetical protein
MVVAPDDGHRTPNGQGGAGQPTSEDGTTQVRRRAEHMRNVMSSYRTGTLRGRSDAAAREHEPITPEWTEVSVEPTRTDDKPEEGA